MLSLRRYCLFIINKNRQQQLGHNWTQGVSLNQPNQLHLHTYPKANMFKDASQTQAQTGQSNHNQSVIASVERPTLSLLPSRLNSPTPLVTNTATTNIGTTKQNTNNFNTQIARNDQGSDTTDAVIISQLQQLQSPPPQPPSRESPIFQATKTRHRGFFSRLLCCFRPASSIVYQDPRDEYENSGDNAEQKYRDLPQHQGSQKYSGTYLLPARKSSDNRICLVIDLDETLVHSSFKPIENADFIVPVEIDGTLHKVYVLKRPHVDEFLKKMGQLYECVLFTASLAKYADPVADLLDTGNIFKARLFRESCAFYRGNYVKDLSRLGRDLDRVIIVDNSPASYIFHPENAVSVPSFSFSLSLSLYD